MQQTSKTSKNNLKSLEEQILADYEVNKFQIRYLFQSLLLLKPHYEILGELFHTKSTQNTLFSGDQLQKENICLGIEIYDSNEKVIKFLQVYLLNTFQPTQFYLLKQTAQRIQSFGRPDLILQLLDFYGLDSDSKNELSKDNDFFIAEFEMFDMSLQEYEYNLGTMPTHITRLIKYQLEYCLQISEMAMSLFKSYSDFVYLQSEDSGKIKLKINLLQIGHSVDHDISNYLLSQYQLPQRTNENNSKGEQNQVDEAQIIVQQKREAFQKQIYQQSENTKFVELFTEIDLTITKKEFISSLLSKNPHTLKLHGEVVFKIISENPKYQEFEIIEMNAKKFVFKVSQIDGVISYLEGKKCESLVEAQQLLEKYEKLKLINEVTAITNVELIATGEEGYYSLLIEKKDKGLRGNNKKDNLVDFLNKQPRDFGDQFGISFQSYLYEFAKLCYNLLTQHQIQINRINLLQIFVLKMEDNQDSQEIFQILVNDFDEDDYTHLYSQYFLSFFNITNPSDNDRFQKILLKQFFNSIFSNKNNEVEQSFQKIEKSFNQYKTNKRLEKSALENNIRIHINFGDTQLDRLDVYIQSFELSKQSIVFFRNLLNGLSLNYLSWNTLLSYENIFQYMISVKQPAPELLNEQKDIIKQFYQSQQGYTQQQIEITVSELNNLLKKYEMKMNLSVENIKLEYQDIILFNAEFQEEKQIDHLKEIFSESQTCLRISFSQQENKSEESSSIKFIVADNKFIVVLCVSPLIVQCQSSSNIFFMEQYFLRAEQYQTLKYFQPSENRNILFKDMPLVQLLITKEIKDLKSFELFLKTEDYEKYNNYSALLGEHKSLQKLTICLQYSKQNNNIQHQGGFLGMNNQHQGGLFGANNHHQGGIFGGNHQNQGGLLGMHNQNQGGIFGGNNQNYGLLGMYNQNQGGLFGVNNQQLSGLLGANQLQNNAQINEIKEDKREWIATELKGMINQPKNLNTLLINTLNNREDKTAMILKSKIYKCSRLVKIDIQKQIGLFS